MSCIRLILIFALPLASLACSRAERVTTPNDVWRGLECIELPLAQKLLIVKGSRGIVACPYLNVETFARTGEACAIVPAVDFEAMPTGTVRAVTPAAEALGIKVGMSGREALERIR